MPSSSAIIAGEQYGEFSILPALYIIGLKSFVLGFFLLSSRQAEIKKNAMTANQ